MPVDFAETPEGKLFIADGFGPMMKWDGFNTQLVPVGVPKPYTALTLAAATTPGAILGTYYAFVRFVDADGLVGDLSPISAEAEIINSTTYFIAGVTNVSPLTVTTSAPHNFQTGNRVVVEGVEGQVGANGTWDIERINDTQFVLLESVAVATYTAGGTVRSGVAQVNYSAIPTSSDVRVASRQIFRNTDGQAQTFYLDVTLTDPNVTTASSVLLDADLQTQLSVSLVDGEGRDLANVHGQPPEHKRCVAHNLGRMFAYAEVEYTEGSVAVTLGSNTVYGIGTEWLKTVGLRDTLPDGPAVREPRYLHVVGADDKYLIEGVDVSDQILYLDRPYQGPTDPYAAYAIRAGSEQEDLVYFTEAGLAESWPAFNAFALPSDGDQGTGLVAFRSFLYIVKRKRIYRYTFQSSPLDDGVPFLAALRGCINHRCWALVEDRAYMLDEEGIHEFQSGRSDNGSISTQVQTLFRNDSPQRINWAASRYFHCVHDPSTETVRWFVAMSGQYLPRHAICFQYTLQRWWIEEYAVPVGSSELGKLARQAVLSTWGVGEQQVFLGSQHNRVLALDASRLDGCAEQALMPNGVPAANSGTVLSSGPQSLTVERDWTSEAVGAPLVIVAGRGEGQVRIATAIDGSTIYLRTPWLIRPDTTSKFQIGGIPWSWRSGWYRWAEEESDNRRRVNIDFEPTTEDRTMYVRRYRDRSDTPLVLAYSRNEDGCRSVAGESEIEVNMRQPSGSVMIGFHNSKEALTAGQSMASIELRGVGSAEPTRIAELTIEGALPSTPAQEGG